MRKATRKPISLSARIELRRREDRVSSGIDAREEWNRYRQANASVEVVDTLKEMAGKRQRCLYCSDSLATDVEHFRPLSTWPDYTFQWRNLLWICTSCNRKKNNSFRQDADGNPLLIDPTRVDPWSVLILDSATGFLAPRFREGDFDAMGDNTLDVLDVLIEEPLTEGRRITAKRLKSQMAQAASSGDAAELFSEVRDEGQGIASWFTIWEGADDKEAADLRQQRPDLWRRLVRLSVALR